jgi:hypothetical protein
MHTATQSAPAAPPPLRRRPVHTPPIGPAFHAYPQQLNTTHTRKWTSQKRTTACTVWCAICVSVRVSVCSCCCRAAHRGSARMGNVNVVGPNEAMVVSGELLCFACWRSPNIVSTLVLTHTHTHTHRWLLRLADEKGGRWRLCLVVVAREQCAKVRLCRAVLVDGRYSTNALLFVVAGSRSKS